MPFGASFARRTGARHNDCVRPLRGIGSRLWRTPESVAATRQGELGGRSCRSMVAARTLTNWKAPPERTIQLTTRQPTNAIATHRPVLGVNKRARYADNSCGRPRDPAVMRRLSQNKKRACTACIGAGPHRPARHRRSEGAGRRTRCPSACGSRDTRSRTAAVRRTSGRVVRSGSGGRSRRSLLLAGPADVHDEDINQGAPRPGQAVVQHSPEFFRGLWPLETVRMRR